MIREYFGGHLMQNSLGIPYEDQGSSWLYFFSVNDVCKVKTVINKKNVSSIIFYFYPRNFHQDPHFYT